MRVGLACAVMIACGLAHAEIQTQKLTYQADDGTVLHGYYAYDDSLTGPRPGVVVVHEWWGLNSYAQKRARDLAALGYSALAIDMYGEGQHTEHPTEAMAFMQAALADAPRAQQRFMAGVRELQKQPHTEADKIAAIGYCFGGKVVLDMARQGAPLAAVVSFHGALATQTPAQPGSVKAKVLVLNGEDDSMISAQQIADFKAEMQQANAAYSFINLPDAKHGFSNPDADQHQAQGLDVAYNAKADQLSWQKMKALLSTVF